MNSWLEQLQPIITEFKDGNPKLSLEDVMRLTQIIQAKINLAEGNICEKTYEAILNSRETSEAYTLSAMTEQARNYLCDGDLTVEEQVLLILKECEEDEEVLLSSIDGVVVWESFSGESWNVGEFLELINPDYL